MTTSNRPTPAELAEAIAAGTIRLGIPPLPPHVRIQMGRWKGKTYRWKKCQP